MSFQFSIVTQNPCLNVLPPVDTRCSDPAYRLAHPDQCPIQPSLVIKPAVALVCQLGSVQFKAFIVQNGAEIDVTASSTFTTSDLGTAWVGVKSGNATGIAAGVATVTAHYQDLTAHAEMNVMGCTGAQCDSHVAMLLLVDNSKSMSQAFSASYSTKLAYAKAAAIDFAETINTTKDFIGAMSFNANSATLLDSPTHDAAGVALDLATIAQTQQLTTFKGAFDAAIAELNAATADLRVLVLISDGEDTTTEYTDDNNPLIPIEAFKAAGGIVICLGTRAHDAGFNFLEAVSTGGFFLNAYGTTQDTALGYLKGLRGYICAGNCTPAGDVIDYKGVSNFSGFINWDVTQGEVDLLGNGFYDVLPGNGLYVDLRGSGDLNGNYDIPIFQSSANYHLLSGHVYRVAVDLAGNQVMARPGDTVSLRVFSGGVTVLAQQIAMPDYTQGFHTYSFSFTAPSDMDAKIEIQQTNDTGHDLGGVLLGRVKFGDTTDIINLLDDDFDTENPTYIPPRCGLAHYYYAGHYAYGYNCYGEGCLDSPPGVQLSDPSPLSDIESGFTPPVIYSSTKEACATCGAGSMNLSITNLIPVMTGPTTPSGAASASGEDANYKAWGAFDGTKPVSGGIPHNSVWDLASPIFPVWLRYDFPAAHAVRHYEVTGSGTSSGFLSAPKDWIFQGSNNGTDWTDLDTVSGIQFFNGETKKFLVDSPGSYLSYRLYITAGKSATNVGVVELAMFAAVDQSICATASYESQISQGDADAQAYALALADAAGQLNCATIYTSTEQYTASCAYGLFPVTRSATATSLNSQQEANDSATAAAKVLAEAARDCTQSNNDQQISITDYPGVAVPYPSIKYVSSSTPIALVTVSLTKLNQFFPVDIVCVLQAPNGTAVVLFAKAGNAPAVNVSMTFADAGATVAPAGGPLVNGSVYRPGHNGSYLALPAPGPAQPHQTTLASLIGSNPSGLWALWLLDTTSGQGTGTLDSWDLNIS